MHRVLIWVWLLSTGAAFAEPSCFRSALRAASPHRSWVDFHLSCRGEKSNSLLVSERPELESIVPKLLDWIAIQSVKPGANKTDLMGVFNNLREAYQEKKLTYRSLLYATVDVAFFAGADQFEKRQHGRDYIDLILKKGGVLLPVIQEEPMSSEAILETWGAIVYPIQLVGSRKSADSRVRSIYGFLLHDLTHAEIDIADRANYIPGKGLAEYLYKSEWAYHQLLYQAQLLSPSESTFTMRVALELLHENLYMDDLAHPLSSDPIQLFARLRNRSTAETTAFELFRRLTGQGAVAWNAEPATRDRYLRTLSWVCNQLEISIVP